MYTPQGHSLFTGDIRMRLERVTVRNFRSHFVRSGEKPEPLEIGPGLNLLVGPNNCGKSNLLKALALALGDDATHVYDRDLDSPSQMAWSRPVITVTFACNSNRSVERTLLKLCDTYERTAGSANPLASEDLVRYRVSFSGAGRDETILARGVGNRRGDPAKLQKALDQLRGCVRFVYLRSGESLRNFLSESFREILHTVMSENLKGGMKKAERRRREFSAGIVEDLLQPLENHALAALQGVMQEICEVSITPSVPGLRSAIAHSHIQIKDTAETDLLSKGTGVRGAALVAILGYLAKYSKRSLVLAVEEPESFLHPSAQRQLRADLARIAQKSNVSLLVTTHSPFMLDRSPSARITSFKKRSDGRTVVEATATGDQPHIHVTTGLFDESVTPHVLDESYRIRTNARAVVYVEGYTDQAYLGLALKVAGREDLLDDIEIRYSGGASKLAADAIITRQLAGPEIPILALLDYDEIGKSTMNSLKSRFNWHGKHVFTYREWKKLEPSTVPVEAEDMFSQRILRAFLDRAGDVVLAEQQRFIGGTFHYGFTDAGKGEFMEYLEKHATLADVKTWISIATELRKRAKLDSGG